MAKTCPLCKEDMAAFDIETLTLDRCESCHGVWFDANELREYGVQMGLGKMPVRASKLGDRIEGLACPNCETALLAPAVQDSLTMHGCSKCTGWFLSGPEMSKLERRYRDNVLGHRPAGLPGDHPPVPSGDGRLMDAIRHFFFG